MPWKTVFTSSLALLLTCISSFSYARMEFIRGVINDPTPDRFSVCSDHGCQKLTIIESFKKEWALIENMFTHQPPTTAEEERQRIAKAVGMMEALVAPYSGTAGDKAMNSFFKVKGRTDCEDESINTTNYIKLMLKSNLLKFHEVDERKHRFPPHYTATIKESKTGDIFAVDSWFLDNGFEALVVTAKEWRWFWHPEAGVENQVEQFLAQKLPDSDVKVEYRQGRDPFPNPHRRNFN